jgi:hypothetical protein
MKNKLNIIFCGYRTWAINVINELKSHPRIDNYIICENHKSLNLLNLENFNVLITVGLSDELYDVCDNIETIGVHCAELDRYSYGTPIQLQIIDGLGETKHRIFKFVNPGKEEIRAHTHTREFSHEVSLSLGGTIENIFNNLTKTAITLFNKYLEDYPEISWKKWPEEKLKKIARKPKDSNIKLMLCLKENFTTRSVYDFIRCLGEPYPNAFLEDEEGILKFKAVEYYTK